MKIGILGAGGIAVQMAKTVAGMKDVENYAVAARSFERAQAYRGTDRGEFSACERAWIR